MGIDQSDSRPTTSAEGELEDGDAMRFDPTATRVGLRSDAGPLTVLLVLAGSGMQGYANGTMDALFVALLLLFAGIASVSLMFAGRRYELRAFLLTFGVCVFVGGLAQCYSLATFGDPLSTTDALSFFAVILEEPPYYTWDELKFFYSAEIGYAGRGAPLAIAVWQGIYHVRGLLGFDFGPYIGVMFNALVMGLAASITVCTARELFGNDAWRLRRVGTLFACCGLFILFGSILLRDCFTTFFNALVVWGIITWLSRPSLRSTLFAGALTIFAIGAMMFLRSRSIVLFGLFWALALSCWFLAKRLDMARLLASGLIMCALLFGSVYLMNYVKASQALQSRNIDKYETIMGAGHQEDSLAMRLVVNQPLPVRLVLGTGTLMVFPIPLWAYFHSEESEYHLIKGYHGLYQLLILPLVLAGIIMAVRAFGKDRQRAIPLLFLAVYLLMNILAVVATSLEQRHIAQFMPAMIILAAVPDTRERETRKTVWDCALVWIFVVVLVHLAWALAAMGR